MPSDIVVRNKARRDSRGVASDLAAGEGFGNDSERLRHALSMYLRGRNELQKQTWRA